MSKTTLHPSTAKRLATAHGEQYKTDPEGLRAILAGELEPAQIDAFFTYMAGVVSGPAKPGPTSGANTSTKPGSGSTAPADGPYRLWDVQKGKWEVIDGNRIFTKLGDKDVKRGIAMTIQEAETFNQARAGVDNNVITERMIPHVEK